MPGRKSNGGKRPVVPSDGFARAESDDIPEGGSVLLTGTDASRWID
jgi:hypothetical protein